MTNEHKGVVGAIVGFGGMVVIICLLFLGGLWTEYAPDAREFLIAMADQPLSRRLVTAGGLMLVALAIWMMPE